MTPSEFVQQLVNALSLGSIYALLALGLSMVYGVMGMLNFTSIVLFPTVASVAFAVMLCTPSDKADVVML